jgi:hypothetical protein
MSETEHPRESETEGAEQSHEDSPTVEEDDPWETWERGGREFVTVRKGGTIAPNSTVYDRYLEGNEGVMLRRRGEDDVIALAPTEEYREDDDRYYKLGSEESNGAVHATTFLKVHDLFGEESRRYVPEWDNEHEHLVIDLREDGEIATQSSSSNKEN